MMEIARGGTRAWINSPEFAVALGRLTKGIETMVQTGADLNDDSVTPFTCGGRAERQADLILSNPAVLLSTGGFRYSLRWTTATLMLSLCSSPRV